MKYRIVGDIHGQIDVMEEALNGDADRVIFCGDFVDSWRRPVEDQIKCIDLALEFAGKGRVDAVWANHEWSYLHSKMACSGYNREMAEYLFPKTDELLTKFKPFIYEGGFLITHAGLSNIIWEDQMLTLDNFQQVLTEWSKNMDSPFFDIGYARGGSAACGGPLWCDFNYEFEPIPELPQVFGHTRGRGIRKVGNAFCIDTLENTEPQFFDFEV